MATRRQSLVASVTRRYPLYSGCGSLANHQVVQRAAGPGNGTGWCKVHGGHWVAAPLGDFGGRAAFYSGELDRKITWVCSRLVRPGDTVVDIGANLGLVTFALAAQVGPAGRVHAFEPNPEMCGLIERGIARNRLRNVQLHRTALGAEAGELTLSVPSGHAGSASLVEDRQSADSCRIRVPVQTLTGAMEEREAEPVRLVKIDVEGFEPQVLEGARGFFARTPPDAVLFELWDNGGGNLGEHPTLQTLSEHGYGFFSIPKRLFRMRLHRLPLDRQVPARQVGHDFLAARLGRTYEDVSRLVRAGGPVG